MNVSKLRMPRMLLVAALVPAIAQAGFAVSSFKKTSRSMESGEFGAQAAIDGDPRTAWVIDPEQDNAGQWIEVDVPMGKVDRVSVIVGWSRDDSTWKDHARVKDVRIQVIDMEGGSSKVAFEKEVTFEDKPERQVVDLPDVQVGGEFSGGKVRLTVVGVYPGQDFAHLALGELLIHMVEFDAATINVTTAPDSAAEGHGGEALNDSNPKTFWAAGKEGPSSFAVGGGKYSVSSIGLTQGPTTHGRPKVVEITQSDVTLKVELVDKPGAVQWYDLPALVGYNGSSDGPVTVRVIEVYPGSTSAAPAFAEVKFRATVLEAF